MLETLYVVAAVVVVHLLFWLGIRLVNRLDGTAAARAQAEDERCRSDLRARRIWEAERTRAPKTTTLTIPFYLCLQRSSHDALTLNAAVDLWLAENCTGKFWFLDYHGFPSRPEIEFELPTDATLFKLKWL